MYTLTTYYNIETCYIYFLGELLMVKSTVNIKATAKLEEEVKKELLIPDPPTEKAKAIILDNEVKKEKNED